LTMVRRRFNRDTIRTPGQDAPSAGDRYMHFLNRDWFYNTPHYKTGFFNEGPALNAARMALEFNRPLEYDELVSAAGGSNRPEDFREDNILAREAGLVPESFNFGTPEEEIDTLTTMSQNLQDVRDGVKTREEIADETSDTDHMRVVQGRRQDGYFLPDHHFNMINEDAKKKSGNTKTSVYDTMRALINARLMDVPVRDLGRLTDQGRARPPRIMEDFYDTTRYELDGFGGQYLPRTRGAKASDTKRLTALAKPEGAGEDTPVFADALTRQMEPEAAAAFRRLLSSEAADLLNTMQERRRLDRIDREFGPMEDMGDVSVGTEAFPEDFQIMRRSEGEIFREAWDVLKEEAPIDSMDWDLHLYHPEYGNIRSSKEIQQMRDFELADGTVLPVAYEVFHGIDGRVEYFSPEAMGAAKTPYDLSEGDLTELARYGCYGCDKDMDVYDHADNEGMCDECHLKYPDGV